MKRIFPLVLFLCAAAQASAVTVFSENFTSTAPGDRVGPWSYDAGNLWRVIDTDTTLDPSAPHHTFFNDGKGVSTGQQNVAASFSQITLGIGDYIELSLDYRYLAAPDDPSTMSPPQAFNFLRFGLYNSNRGSAHTISGSTFTDDTGYLADVSYWAHNFYTGSATKTGDYALRKEVNVYDDFRMGMLLDNLSVVDLSPMGDIQTMSAVAKATTDGTTVHSARLLITNTGTGIQTDLFMDGSVTASVTSVDPFSGYTFGAPITGFDTLWFEAPSDNNGFAIDNVRVASSVPEPGSSLMVVLGALVGLARRGRAGSLNRPRP